MSGGWDSNEDDGETHHKKSKSHKKSKKSKSHKKDTTDLERQTSGRTTTWNTDPLGFKRRVTVTTDAVGFGALTRKHSHRNQNGHADMLGLGRITGAVGKTTGAAVGMATKGVGTLTSTATGAVGKTTGAALGMATKGVGTLTSTATGAVGVMTGRRHTMNYVDNVSEDRSSTSDGTGTDGSVRDAKKETESHHWKITSAATGAVGKTTGAALGMATKGVGTLTSTATGAVGVMTGRRHTMNDVDDINGETSEGVGSKHGKSKQNGETFKLAVLYWRSDLGIPENGSIRLRGTELSFNGMISTRLSFDLKYMEIEEVTRMGGLQNDAFRIFVNPKYVNPASKGGGSYVFSTVLKSRKEVIKTIQAAMDNAQTDKVKEEVTATEGGLGALTLNAEVEGAAGSVASGEADSSVDEVARNSFDKKKRNGVITNTAKRFSLASGGGEADSNDEESAGNIKNGKDSARNNKNTKASSNGKVLLKFAAMYWRKGLGVPENGNIHLSNTELSFKGMMSTRLSFDLKDIAIEEATRMGGHKKDAFRIFVKPMDANNTASNSGQDGKRDKKEGLSYLFSTVLKSRSEVMEQILAAMNNANPTIIEEELDASSNSDDDDFALDEATVATLMTLAKADPENKDLAASINKALRGMLFSFGSFNIFKPSSVGEAAMNVRTRLKELEEVSLKSVSEEQQDDIAKEMKAIEKSLKRIERISKTPPTPSPPTFVG